MTETTKTHVILLSCGSFNPITKGHIHMFGKYFAYSWGSGCACWFLIQPFVVWVCRGVYGDREDFRHCDVTLDDKFVAVMNSYCRPLSKTEVLKWATASEPRMIKSSLSSGEGTAHARVYQKYLYINLHLLRTQAIYYCDLWHFIKCN